MPRNTREQNRMIDEAQRHVITVRPQTVSGGFLPAAALPFIAAAATPLISKGATWLGHKIFGNGILQSGARAGAGLLRAGDRMPRTMSGGSRSTHYRSGDYMMPSMMPIMNYRTGTSAGMQGGMLMNVPGLLDRVKDVISKITTLGGKKKKKTKGKGCCGKKKH